MKTTMDTIREQSLTIDYLVKSNAELSLDNAELGLRVAELSREVTRRGMIIRKALNLLGRMFNILP